MNRREALFGVGGAVAGVAGALGGRTATDALAERNPLPFYGGFASAIRPDLRGPSCAGGALHWWGRRDRRTIALTFDDGPHPNWTPRVLEALAAAHVPATFFVKGVNVRDHGRIHAADAPHEIANHTWDHPDLARLDHAAVAEQIRRCTEAIEDAYGRSPMLFRPPYGHLGGSTVLAAAEAGLPVVLWSAQMKESDFLDRPDGVVADILGQVAAGSIVLAHDTGPEQRLIAIDRLGAIITGLQDNGFEFVTASAVLS